VNILIGKKDANDEEVYAAAKMARYNEFIRAMPEGYNTLIGENGSTLSGANASASPSPGHCSRMRLLFCYTQFFYPAFVVAPRHPWRGKFVLFRNVINYFKNPYS
jgi:hypothetical protein